jgi:NTP pyrophosphatase (non-canonical NTP hydrolase)
MIYYIYHIPGKKIGVTTDLNERVTVQQGYDIGEYTVVYATDDIIDVSQKELELQRAFGYKVDHVPYKDLKPNIKKLNTMNINVTEATTTFPCPVDKLKGRLMDELGMQWHTSHGEFTLTTSSINWIMANVKTSMYNKDRCYVYNKAFQKYWSEDPKRGIIPMTTHPATVEPDVDIDRINKKLFEGYGSDYVYFDKIRAWADKRGLYDKGDTKTQYVKLTEELGETGKAILKQDTPEIIDGIGDMVVVLTNLAHLAGTTIENCIEHAYREISDRKGTMINGTFVKEQKTVKYNDTL